MQAKLLLETVGHSTIFIGSILNRTWESYWKLRSQVYTGIRIKARVQSQFNLSYYYTLPTEVECTTRSFHVSQLLLHPHCAPNAIFDIGPQEVMNQLKTHLLAWEHLLMEPIKAEDDRDLEEMLTLVQEELCWDCPSKS